MKGKMKGVLLIAVFILSTITLAIPVMADETSDSYETAIIAAADRLLETQNNDGGWEWNDPETEPGSGTSGLNTLGVTAQGLLDAYKLTGVQAYLDACILTYTEGMLTKPLAPTWRIRGPDIPFLVELSEVTTDSTYADFAKARYDAALLEATWGGGSATGFAEYIRDARKGSYPAVISWDINLYIEGALALERYYPGEYPADAAEMVEVIYNALYGISPDFDFENTAQNEYWLAYTGAIEAFITTGLHTEEVPSLKTELLLSQSGGFTGVGDGSDAQTTAYAIMALLDTDDLVACIEAVDYLLANQLEDGGWLYSPGVENTEVTSEAAQALYDLYGQYLDALPSVPGDPVETTVTGDGSLIAPDADTTVKYTLEGEETIIIEDLSAGDVAPATFWALGEYVDVKLEANSNVTELMITVYYGDTYLDADELDFIMYWLDGADWVECSDYTVNVVANSITATVNDVDTSPLISQMTGTPFGPGVGLTIVEDFSIDYVTPGDVDYGDVLTVIGSDVTAGAEIKVFWDYASGTYAHFLNNTEGNPNGTFDLEVTVPSDIVGDHYLWVIDVSTGATIGWGPIPVIPLLKLSPSSGLVDDEITVKGYGYSAESEITFTFDTDPLTTSPSIPETDEDGYFTATFDVPTDTIYGSYTVVATDEDTKTDSATFTVGASLTLNVEKGPEGTVVEVTGIGFAAMTITDISVEFAGKAVLLVGDEVDVTGPTDEFDLEIVVPSAGEGEYDIMIHDLTAPGTDVTVEFEIDGEASITVSPTYGAPGATITVTGANFTQIAGTEVTLDLWFADASAASLDTVDTNADGTFETTFISPAVTFENYDVRANDALYGIVAMDAFKVGMIALIINPTSGGSGTDIGITGVGFAEGDFNLTFGEELYEYPNGVEANEIIAKTFYVPNVEVGTYYVTVIDEDENELTATFIVTESTIASVDPVVAPTDYNVSISGNNFADAVADVDFVIYNSTDEWEMLVQTSTGEGPVVADTATDSDGNFTGWWLVDADLSNGDYTINVTGGEGLLVQLDFSVVDARVSVAPRKALFARGETVSFDISNDFDLPESTIEIYGPDDTLYWITDPFSDGEITGTVNVWVVVNDLYTVPYYRQTANANPMELQSDAPLGTWLYVMYYDGDELMNGTFVVGLSTAAQVDEMMDDVMSEIAGLSDDLAGITDDIADELAALSDEIGGVTSDMDALREDIVTDIADDIAQATDAGQAALDAVEDLAGSMSDLGDAVSDIADIASDSAEASQAAADAANDAVQAANDAQDSASGLTGLVYGAIGASLIAALAAIISLMQISRRIAG